LEALTLVGSDPAMENESLPQGVTHYADLRDSVSDPKEKAFFDLLSRCENEHYLSFKDTEEYFIDAASWYRKLEHHTFDGE